AAGELLALRLAGNAALLAREDRAALDRAVGRPAAVLACAGRRRGALAGLGENRPGERPKRGDENDSKQFHPFPLPANGSKFDALPLMAAAAVSRPGALR